jgi:hypothetical protein
MKTVLAAFALVASTGAAQAALTDKPLSDRACFAAAREAVTSSKNYYRTWDPATVKQFELRIAGRKGVLPLTEGQMFGVRPLLDGLAAQENVWKDLSISLSDDEFWRARSVSDILMRRTANKDNCLERVERVLTQASLHRWQNPRPSADALVREAPNPNTPQQCALKAAEALENIHYVMQPNNPNYFTLAQAVEKLRLGGVPLPAFQAQIAAAYATAPAGPSGHAEIWRVDLNASEYSKNFKANCERQLYLKLTR